MAMGTTPR